MGLRVVTDSESVTNSEKALLNNKDKRSLVDLVKDIATHLYGCNLC